MLATAATVNLKKIPGKITLLHMNHCVKVVSAITRSRSDTSHRYCSVLWYFFSYILVYIFFFFLLVILRLGFMASIDDDAGRLLFALSVWRRPLINVSKYRKMQTHKVDCGPAYWASKKRQRSDKIRAIYIETNANSSETHTEKNVFRMANLNNPQQYYKTLFIDYNNRWEFLLSKTLAWIRHTEACAT